MRTIRFVNALVPGRGPCDITVVDGSISAIEPAPSPAEPDPGHTVVDLEGRLVVPGFVEPHAHLDKAYLSSRIDNITGDLVGAIAGIVSERDVIRSLQERGAEVLRAPVADIMSGAVLTCVPEDRVDDLAAVMTDHRVRHIPVLAEGRLAGIVSIGDVVKNRLEELGAERQQLEAYITQGG